MVDPPILNNNAISNSNSHSNSNNSHSISGDQINEELEPPNPKGGVNPIHHPTRISIASSISTNNSTPSSSSPISEKQPQDVQVQAGNINGGSSLQTFPPSLHQPHTLTEEQTVQLLLSNLNHGLDSKEAENRLKPFGPNQIKEIKGASAWTIFLRCVMMSRRLRHSGCPLLLLPSLTCLSIQFYSTLIFTDNALTL